MIKNVLIIGAGGFIGTVLRYLTTLFFTKQFPGLLFPLGTWMVNIIGCLVIGIVFGLSQRFMFHDSPWRMFLTIGICGGYTTFSAFAYENILLLQQSDYTTFALYAISSFVLCLLAVWIGLSLTRVF
ncbi:MAG TPA: fluoride efflux transporter CrcB [Ferruginibacter sp.]|nr:fluoride efflux transporter CrcB [Ferruginibacter sp.]